jgi:hypothetical protein
MAEHLLRHANLFYVDRLHPVGIELIAAIRRLID